MRNCRSRSMASTRTAMFSGSGRCCRALPACGSTSAPPTNDWRPILYRRGVTLVHLQRAIWLGCARKYAALLNGSEHAPMLVSSLKYFSALIEEVAETSVGEDYWKHMQHKVNQLERMWLEQTPAGR